MGLPFLRRRSAPRRALGRSCDEADAVSRARGHHDRSCGPSALTAPQPGESNGVGGRRWPHRGCGLQWGGVAMALTLREHFEFPELWRRFFEPDVMGGGFMRVEEFVDGDAMVIRAEMPGIDPDKDVELTISDGVLHVRAVRHEKSEEKSKD